jgi:hypothetical protein
MSEALLKYPEASAHAGSGEKRLITNPVHMIAAARRPRNRMEFDPRIAVGRAN